FNEVDEELSFRSTPRARKMRARLRGRLSGINDHDAPGRPKETHPSTHLEMNQGLRSVYEDAWSRGLGQLPSGLGLSNPHFLSVPEAYPRVRRRLMVVGQQTHWWPRGGGYRQGLGHDPVEAIMNLYHDFDLAREYWSTHFWRANHYLYRKLNPGGPRNGFIWSNLVKIDQKQKRPSGSIEEIISAMGLLQAEISICVPDVVVFFTGPRYEELLQRTFPEIRIESLGTETTQVARLVHTSLPRASYRTYHPGYLSRG